MLSCQQHLGNSTNFTSSLNTRPLSPAHPPHSPRFLPQESPFRPALVMLASWYGVRLALLNAHMQPRQLLSWHASVLWRRLLGAMLQRFSLIVPQSDLVGG